MIDVPVAINASLVKKLYFKGESRPLCPLRLQQVDILKKYSETTLSMLKGQYFETASIGSGVYGNKIYDLPRKSISKKQEKENRIAELQGQGIIHVGEPTIDQVRIDNQVAVFKKEAMDRMIAISKDNVQLTIFKWINGILCKGTLDIFPCFVDFGGTPKLMIIDLKLTKDINGTYPAEFGWGDPERMDHIQADMYNELVKDIDFELNPHLVGKISEETKLMLDRGDFWFAYWVFDYKDKSENKWVFSSYDATKQKELFEAIRKTNNAVNDYYPVNGWITNPDFERCKTCPVKECKDRKTYQFI